MRPAVALAPVVLALAITTGVLAGDSADVTNPGFEFPDQPSGGFTEISAGQAFGGWEPTGGSVTVIDRAYEEPPYRFTSAQGDQWVDLSGVSGGAGVRQALMLQPGLQYTLSWSVGNVSGTNAGTFYGTNSSVRLLIDGNPVRTVTNTQPGTTMQWQRFTHTFQGKNSIVIEFRDVDPANDPVDGLDNVRLVAGAEPRVGETANAAPVKGDVLVQLRKGGPFVPLSDARAIPIGATVDATEGTVKLTTASNQAGKPQSGKFSAGLFQVLQSRKRKAKGLTELRLKGSAAGFKNCRGARAALSRRTVRRLRANAKGRFRTRGRHSAATVRGTKWTMEDRCDGTLTKVKRGTVVVRDFRLKKTVTVTAGKSYLAKASG